MTRRRIRRYATSSGTATLIDGGSSQVSTSEGFFEDECYDAPSPRDQNMSIDHYYCTGGGISNIWIEDPIPPRKVILQNWSPLWFRNAPPIGHVDDPSLPSNPYLALQILNRTNPSRPRVDLPTSLLELRELPDLIRSVGTDVFKRIARGNLKYEYGAKPVLSDLAKLCNFAKDVENRLKLLQRLQEKSIIRKVQLYSNTVSVQPNSYHGTNSWPPWLQCTHVTTDITSVYKVWGYVRWTPNIAFKDKGVFNADRMLYLSRRIVLGASPDLSTLWNALPWSWLVDWFGNMGDYLEAHRSSIPVTPDVPVICKSITTTRTFVMENSNFGVPKGMHTATWNLSSKYRNRAGASLPSAYLPFFSGKQMGILASLAALRGR